MKKETGFTIVELLVTIGIVSILSTAVVTILNPVEYLRQARDSTRVGDVSSLTNVLNFIETQEEITDFGSPKTIYTSLVASSEDCADLDLPDLSDGWQYHCVQSLDALYKIDGSGWLPVDLSSVSGTFSLSNLPVDPINSVASCGYYMLAYESSDNWEFGTSLESIKIKALAQKDGGLNDSLYEKGRDLSILASNSCTPTDPGETPQVVSQEFSFISAGDDDPTPADGETTAWSFVDVRDQFDQPIVGLDDVTCDLTGEGTWTSGSPGPLGPVNPEGWTSCAMKSTVVEEKTITATAGGVEITNTDTFTFTSPATAGNSSVEVEGTATAPADGVSQISILLTARNGDGALVKNAWGYLEVSGDENEIDSPSSETDENGEILFTVTSIVPEVKTVTGYVGAIPITGTVDITFTE